jgi:CRISPR/Cas system CSM-associated protein Csm3 (group 7 of RAMP superfamily)
MIEKNETTKPIIRKKDQLSGFQTTLNRYRIKGQIETTSPLHISSGANRYISMKQSKELIAVRAVPICNNNCPYIPGASLRGMLRAWTESTRPDAVNELWGFIAQKTGEENEESQESGRGGKVIVHNAYFSPINKKKPPKIFFENRRHCDIDRWTYVQHACAIDRFSKTASHHQLFYQEVIPPKTLFDIVIDIKNSNPEELEIIMNALESFNAKNKLAQIGGDKSAGYGQCVWQTDQAEITGLESKEAIQEWLNDKASCGFAGFPVIERQSSNFSATSQSVISIDLTLDFIGAMVVNDPTICENAQDSKKQEDKPTANTNPIQNANGEKNISTHNVTANTNPIQNANGENIIPAQSIKGAIRSQAERILRTMVENRQPGASPDIMKKIACYPTQKSLACEPLSEDQTELCIACTLFGAQGWLSPFGTTDFTLDNTPEEVQQEFVAIDRFTGGGAAHKKYKSKALYKPVFKGKIHLDLLRRYQNIGIDPAHLGLLMLVFRDLAEQDIQIGYGASKGFGLCRASMTCHPDNQLALDTYDISILANALSMNWTDDIRNQVVVWVKALESMIDNKLKGVNHVGS